MPNASDARAAGRPDASWFAAQGLPPMRRDQAAFGSLGFPFLEIRLYFFDLQIAIDD
jgi:hypothetical protein